MKAENFVKSYHFGLLKKYKKLDGASDKIVILQVSETKDGLSCELWKYLGERMNSIAQLKKDRQALLVAINFCYGTDFQHLVITGN